MKTLNQMKHTKKMMIEKYHNFIFTLLKLKVNRMYKENHVEDANCLET